MSIWNPWTGCSRCGEGCLHCSAADGSGGIFLTPDWDLPLRRKKDGAYELQSDGGYVSVCAFSDFLHPMADAYRRDAWHMMRAREDLQFVFATRRIQRFYASLPFDWRGGYHNVAVACVCENMRSAETKLPAFFELAIRRRYLIFRPLLEPIDMEAYFKKYGAESLQGVVCGGEEGSRARICDFNWILALRTACEKYRVPFCFAQTGSYFRKDGKIYRLEPEIQRLQAAKANIDLFY